MTVIDLLLLLLIAGVCGSIGRAIGGYSHGGCLVLQESFEAVEALALIERERCSVYYGMGNMARALLEHPDHPGRRLGAMRTGLTIGPPEDIAMTISALGAAELCKVYGSTETYGNCTVIDANDPLRSVFHGSKVFVGVLSHNAADRAALNKARSACDGRNRRHRRSCRCPACAPRRSLPASGHPWAGRPCLPSTGQSGQAP